MGVDNFRNWLQNLSSGEYGDTVDLAKETGLSQGHISKLLTGKAKGDPRASTLIQIAEHMGRDPADLWNEIYGTAKQKKAAQNPKVVVPIDAKYRREWDQLFKSNPRRAKRVLENLVLQERQGYTDLVSKIVSHILKEGPTDALPEIAAEIRNWKKSAKRPSPSRPRTKRNNPN